MMRPFIWLALGVAVLALALPPLLDYVTPHCVDTRASYLGVEMTARACLSKADVEAMGKRMFPAEAR